MEKLIEDLYNSKDWGVTKEEFEKICSSTFQWVVSEVRSGDFSQIRLKHVGTFNPLPFRLNNVIQTYNKFLDQGHITPQMYIEYFEQIQNLVPHASEEARANFEVGLSRARELGNTRE